MALFDWPSLAALATELLTQAGGDDPRASDALLELRSDPSGDAWNPTPGEPLYLVVKAALFPKSAGYGTAAGGVESGLGTPTTRDTAIMDVAALPVLPDGRRAEPRKGDRILLGMGREALTDGAAVFEGRSRLIIEAIPLAPFGPASLVYWKLELA